MVRVVLFISCLLCFILVGCQDAVKKESPVEVFIADGQAFPEFLVGTWKAEGKSGWELTFARNGTITKAVIALGQFEIVPGQTAVVPMKMGKQSIIIPGQWVVQYLPSKSMLTVKIVLKSFHVEIGDGYLEGHSENIFVGHVDSDTNEWLAKWTLFRKATANTPETQNFDLSSDLDYGETNDLVFRKVTE